MLSVQTLFYFLAVAVLAVALPQPPSAVVLSLIASSGRDQLASCLCTLMPTSSCILLEGTQKKGSDPAFVGFADFPLALDPQSQTLYVLYNNLTSLIMRVFSTNGGTLTPKSQCAFPYNSMNGLAFDQATSTIFGISSMQNVEGCLFEVSKIDPVTCESIGTSVCGSTQVRPSRAPPFPHPFVPGAPFPEPSRRFPRQLLLHFPRFQNRKVVARECLTKPPHNQGRAVAAGRP